MTELAIGAVSDALGPTDRLEASVAAFVGVHVAQLARTVGCGECGPGPQLFVRYAAHQAAAAEWHQARAVALLSDSESPKAATEHFAHAARLQNTSRLNLLSAYNLCAIEAKARPKKPGEQTGEDGKLEYLFSTAEDEDDA